ncbi:MAG: MauE/DoxX family redox-associated membrane protein [Mycobacteriales bacterium]
MPAALAPLLVAVLLGWAGVHKLADRTAAEPDSALMRVLPDTRLVAAALRLLGAVELGLVAALLIRPMWTVPGYLTAVLGLGFLGYLRWAGAVAPDASCGCTGSRHAPVTVRSFGRAGLVVAGGLAAAVADRPWWTVVADRPVPAAAVAAAALLVVVALSGDLDEVSLLPLRRARLRLLGHPLPERPGGPVPVAASVELLEQSLAWHAAAPVVRSALLEHWDLDGWRFLRFAGTAGSRPVTVVFAMAADARVETAEPAVRVTVVDAERPEVLPALVTG